MSLYCIVFTTNPNVAAHQIVSSFGFLASFPFFQKCPGDAVDEQFHNRARSFPPCPGRRDGGHYGSTLVFIRISLKVNVSDYAYCISHAYLSHLQYVSINV